MSFPRLKEVTAERAVILSRYAGPVRWEGGGAPHLSPGDRQAQLNIRGSTTWEDGVVRTSEMIEEAKSEGFLSRTTYRLDLIRPGAGE